MVGVGKLLVVAACLFLFAARPAHACSCIGGIPLCESFWKTPVVFEGEALSIESVPNSRGKEFQPHRLVRFKVERVHRGGVHETAEVMTGAGGGDCGYTFKIGVRYLVYASLNTGKLSTGICSRTRPLADAAEDLEYLKTAFTPSQGARVFGRASYQRASYNDAEIPATAYRVILKGEQGEWAAATDAAGRFEFINVATGKYAIRLVVPDTERAYGSHIVEIEDSRGCAAANFTIVPNGRITMRVVDAEWKPKGQLALEAREASDKRAPAASGTTDENGDVTFSPLKPGRYIIGINITKVADAKQPYPTVYYPGVADPDQALVVEVQRGGDLKLETFVLPAPLHLRRLAGTVHWPDGTPAAGVNVHVVGAGTSWITGEGKTDNNGRFSISVYDGITYRVSASITSPAPERATSQASVEGVTVREGMAPVTLQLRRVR